MTIDWREGGPDVAGCMDEIDVHDPHGIWKKLEGDEFRPAVDDKQTLAFKPEGTWVIRHPIKGRPPWLHRVMARILLGWEWRDGR